MVFSGGAFRAYAFACLTLMLGARLFAAPPPAKHVADSIQVEQELAQQAKQVWASKSAGNPFVSVKDALGTTDLESWLADDKLGETGARWQRNLALFREGLRILLDNKTTCQQVDEAFKGVFEKYLYPELDADLKRILEGQGFTTPEAMRGRVLELLRGKRCNPQMLDILRPIMLQALHDAFYEASVKDHPAYEKRSEKLEKKMPPEMHLIIDEYRLAALKDNSHSLAVRYSRFFESAKPFLASAARNDPSVPAELKYWLSKEKWTFPGETKEVIAILNWLRPKITNPANREQQVLGLVYMVLETERGSRSVAHFPPSGDFAQFNLVPADRFSGAAAAQHLAAENQARKQMSSSAPEKIAMLDALAQSHGGLTTERRRALLALPDKHFRLLQLLKKHLPDTNLYPAYAYPRLAELLKTLKTAFDEKVSFDIAHFVPLLSELVVEMKLPVKPALAEALKSEAGRAKILTQLDPRYRALIAKGKGLTLEETAEFYLIELLMSLAKSPPRIAEAAAAAPSPNRHVSGLPSNDKGEAIIRTKDDLDKYLFDLVLRSGNSEKLVTPTGVVFQDVTPHEKKQMLEHLRNMLPGGQRNWVSMPYNWSAREAMEKHARALMDQIGGAGEESLAGIPGMVIPRSGAPAEDIRKASATNAEKVLLILKALQNPDTTRQQLIDLGVLEMAGSTDGMDSRLYWKDPQYRNDKLAESERVEVEKTVLKAYLAAADRLQSLSTNGEEFRTPQSAVLEDFARKDDSLPTLLSVVPKMLEKAGLKLPERLGNRLGRLAALRADDRDALRKWLLAQDPFKLDPETAKALNLMQVAVDWSAHGDFGFHLGTDMKARDKYRNEALARLGGVGHFIPAEGTTMRERDAAAALRLKDPRVSAPWNRLMATRHEWVKDLPQEIRDGVLSLEPAYIGLLALLAEKLGTVELATLLTTPTREAILAAVEKEFDRISGAVIARELATLIKTEPPLSELNVGPVVLDQIRQSLAKLIAAETDKTKQRAMLLAYVAIDEFHLTTEQRNKYVDKLNRFGVDYMLAKIDDEKFLRGLNPRGWGRMIEMQKAAGPIKNMPIWQRLAELQRTRWEGGTASLQATSDFLGNLGVSIDPPITDYTAGNIAKKDEIRRALHARLREALGAQPPGPALAAPLQMGQAAAPDRRKAQAIAFALAQLDEVGIPDTVATKYVPDDKKLTPEHWLSKLDEEAMLLARHPQRAEKLNQWRTQALAHNGGDVPTERRIELLKDYRPFNVGSPTEHNPIQHARYLLDGTMPKPEQLPAQPVSTACLPTFRKDARYFNDPSLEPLLLEIERAQIAHQESLLRNLARFLEPIQGLKQFAGSGWDDISWDKISNAAFLDYTLLLVHLGEKGVPFLHELAVRKLMGMAKESYAKRVAKKDPPFDKPGYPPEDWATFINSPTQVGQAVDRLMAGKGSPPSTSKGLTDWRKWIADGKLKSIDFSRLSFAEASILKEHLLYQFDVESDLRLTEEQRDKKLPFAFTPPLPLTEEEMKQLYAGERKNACKSEPSTEMREWNDFVADFVERKGLARHGLGPRLRATLPGRLADRSFTINGETKPIRRELGELATSLRESDQAEADKKIYNPESVVSILYRSGTENPSHVFEQVRRQLRDQEGFQFREDLAKKEKSSRDVAIARLEYLYLRNGKSLTLGEMSHLREVSDDEFDNFYGLIHAVMGEDPAQGGVRMAASDLWDWIRGKSKDHSNLMGAIIPPTRSQAARVDRSKLKTFELLPTPPNASLGLMVWVAAENMRLINETLEEVEKDPQAPRQKWFPYFDSMYAQTYGESLSKVFCGKTPCDEEQLKKPMTEKEYAAVWRFLRMKQLESENPEIAMTIPPAEVPAMVRRLARVEHEARLLNAALQKLKARIAKVDPVEVNTIAELGRENDHQYRLMWTDFQREIDHAQAQIGELDKTQEGRDKPDMGILAQTVVAYRELQGRMNSDFFEHFSRGSTKMNIGKTVDLIFLCPVGNYPGGGRPTYAVKGVPIEKTSSTTVFLEYYWDRLAKEAAAAEGKTVAELAEEYFNRTQGKMWNSKPADRNLVPNMRYTVQPQYCPPPPHQLLAIGQFAVYWSNEVKQVGYIQAVKGMMDKRLSDLYGFSERLERIEYPGAPKVLRDKATALQKMSTEDARAEIMKLAYGDVAQKKLYSDLIGYVLNFPEDNAVRRVVLGPSMPPHIAKYADDTEFRRLWESAPPEFREQEHAMHYFGLRKEEPSRDALLAKLRASVTAYQQMHGVPVDSQTADRSKEIPTTTPDGALAAPRTFVHDAVQTTIKRVLDAPEADVQTLLMNPPLSFSKLNEYFTQKSDKPGYIDALGQARAYFLLNYARTRRLLRDQKLEQLGDLDKWLKDLTGDDKKKLRRLATSLETIILAIDAKLKEADPSVSDEAYPELDPASMLVKEMDHLEKAIAELPEAERKSFLQSLNKLDHTRFRETKARAEDKAPVEIPDDIKMAGLENCAYFLRNHEGAPGTPPAAPYMGLSNRSRVMLQTMPPFLRDMMETWCKYNWSHIVGGGIARFQGQATDFRGTEFEKLINFDDPEFNRIVAELIHNPWPGKMIHTLVNNQYGRALYLDRAYKLLQKRWIEVEKALATAKAEEKPALEQEKKAILAMLGRDKTGPWANAANGLEDFLKGVTKMKPDVREQFRAWAMEKLIALTPDVGDLSKKSPDEILKKVAEEMSGYRAKPLRDDGTDPETTRQMLVMMIAAIDEGGDGEKGSLARTIETQKGGFVRFAPRAIVALAGKEPKTLAPLPGAIPLQAGVMPGAAPAVPEMTEKAQLINQILSRLHEGGGRGITQRQRIRLNEMGVDSLKKLIALHDGAGRVEDQGLNGVKTLWHQMARSGTEGDITQARHFLTEAQGRFEVATATDFAKLREEVRATIRSGKPFDDKTRERLRVLARAEIYRTWLPKYLESLLSQGGQIDSRRILSAMAIEEARRTDSVTGEVETQLRQDVAREEIENYRAEQRKKAVDEIAAARKLPPENEAVQREADARVTNDLAKILPLVGLSPRDIATVADAEAKLLAPQHQAFLDKITKILGVDAMNDHNRWLADELDKLRESKPKFVNFFESEFGPSLKMKVDQLKKEHGHTLSDREILDRAWTELSAARAHADFQGDLGILRGVVRSDMDRGPAAAARAISEISSQKFCSEEGAKRFEKLAGDAWTGWKKVEEERKQNILSSDAKKKWAEFRKKAERRRNELMGERMVILKKLQKAVHAQESIRRGIQLRKDLKTTEDWHDKEKWPPEAKDALDRAIRYFENELPKREAAARAVYQEEQRFNGRYLEEEEKLRAEEAQLLQELPGQLSMTLMVNPIDRRTFIENFSLGQGFRDIETSRNFNVLVDRYFDWRERAELLGEAVAESSNTVATDPRTAPLLDEVDSCRDGYRVTKPTATKIVQDSFDAKSKKLARRKQLLDVLANYGIVFDGTALDFSNFNGEKGLPQHEELKKVLTELGEYLPTDQSAVWSYLGLPMDLTPWDKFKAILMSKWTLQGRQPYFEWYREDIENRNRGAWGDEAGFAISVEMVDGEPVFKFEKLKDKRVAAKKKADEIVEAVKAMGPQLKDVRLEHNHALPFWDNPDPYKRALQDNLNNLKALIGELDAYGGIKVKIDDKTDALPASFVAEQYRIDGTQRSSDIHQNWHNIGNDMAWRQATLTATVLLFMIPGGQLSPWLAAGLHGARMGFTLTWMTAISEEAMPMFGLKRPEMTWSDRGPQAFKTAAIFAIANMGAHGLTAWATGGSAAAGTLSTTLSAETAATSGLLTRAGMARLAVSPTVHQMGMVYGTSVGVEMLSDAVTAYNYDYKYKPWDSFKTGSLHGAQNAFYMWGPDQRFAGLFKNYWARMGASVAVNQTLSFGFSMYHTFVKQIPALEKQRAEQEKLGNKSAVAEFDRQIAELKTLKHILVTQLSEIPAHIMFARMAAEHGWQRGMMKELASTGTPGSTRTGVVEKVRAQADKEAARWTPKDWMPNWMLRPFGGRGHKPAGEQLFNMALLGMPQYRLDAVRREAEANPNSEARKVIDAVAESLGMRPERLMDAMRAHKQVEGYRAQNPIGDQKQLKALRGLAEADVKREIAAAESAGPQWDGRPVSSLYGELVRLDHTQINLYPLARLIAETDKEKEVSEEVKSLIRAAAFEAGLLDPDAAVRGFYAVRKRNTNPNLTWKEMMEAIRDSHPASGPVANEAVVKKGLLTVDDFKTIWTGKIRGTEIDLYDLSVANILAARKAGIDPEVFLIFMKAELQANPQMTFEEVYRKYLL